MFLLNLLDLFLVVLMKVFHALDVLGDCHLFSIYTVLMLSMEIPFFSELLPGALGLVGNNVSLLQLHFHGFDFGTQFGILVVHVSYQTNLDIVEGAFFLKLVPLLLEDVQGFRHFKLEHEVSNEVIDNNITAQCFWDSLCNSGTFASSILLGCFLHFSFNFKCVEVIEIVIVVSIAFDSEVFN